MTTRRIGIVGGLGAVGRRAAITLQAWGFRDLRIGSRDAARGPAGCARIGDGRAEWRRVDALDAASLRAFCEDCAVIVNCAGPASAIGATIGTAAFAAGADYVDASAYTTLDLPASDRRALLAAGMYPGLSGLAPRWLARQFDRVETLTAYVGGCDHLSETAAIDYVDAIAQRFGAANVAWSGGLRIAHSREPREETVPFFPHPVLLQPYLTTEAERLATALTLQAMRWYSVFDGRHVFNTLAQAGGRAAPAALVRAAEMDLFGRQPYQILLFEMTGTRAGAPLSRTLLIRAGSGADLTGAAAALGVRALLEQDLPAGVHYLAERLDPQRLPALFDLAGVVTGWGLFDEPLTAAEEGEI